MKKNSPKELQRLLSLYLDDVLDSEAKKEFETFLASSPKAAAEFEILKKQRQLLKSKTPLSSNNWFWEQLSVRLQSSKSASDTVYPFSRKYLPLAASLTVIIAAFMGVLMFQQRTLLTRFFSEKKEQVQHLYEDNILQGKLLPLFTDLNKDQVLQFAFFGTLPLDAQAKTALRVDESKEEGARIEFAKNETRQHPPVTVEQFYREVNATPAQHRTLDSILSSAKDKIQESVFLGENKSLAVHADLAKFNRTMMSHMAASLELPQRKRFQRFLVASRSPYTFAIAPALPRGVPKVERRTPIAPRSEQFVVITPDTCTITRINMDMDDVRRNIELASKEFRSADNRAHALIREFAAHARTRNNRNPAFRIYSDSDYFSIRVENNVLDASAETLPYAVVARAPRAVKFQYELRQMPDVQKFFNDDSDIPSQLFNSMPFAPSANVQNRQPLNRRGIDLDSVINAPRDRTQRPQINQTKRRHNNPFEL